MFGVILPRRKRERQRRHGITLAAFADPSIVIPPRPSRPATPPSAAAAAPEKSTPPRSVTPQSQYAPPRAATGTLGATWAEPAAPSEPAPRLRLETTADRHAAVQPADPRPPSLRVHRPVDGTLQFLPGRLEILEGRDIGQEVRFVRQPGTALTEITLGRQDGLPYRHVQLHEPTVSRLHAKMTLEGKEWRLTNLSETNPASVNGIALGAVNGSAILRDGDRIEMGEVAFCFRAK